MARKTPYHLPPSKCVAIHPPVKTRACKHCDHVDECRDQLAYGGTTLCEGLTPNDLELAEREGQLDTIIWWRALPASVTAETVLTWWGHADAP